MVCAGAGSQNLPPTLSSCINHLSASVSTRPGLCTSTCGNHISQKTSGSFDFAW